MVRKASGVQWQGVRFRSLALFYEEWRGKLPISELERASLLFNIGEVHRAGYGRAKRVLDEPMALLGCVLLALTAPLVWLLNLRGNRGPLLYRQDRVGTGRAEEDKSEIQSLMRTSYAVVCLTTKRSDSKSKQLS